MESAFLLRVPSEKLGGWWPDRARSASITVDFPELLAPVMIVRPLPAVPLGTAKTTSLFSLNPRYPEIESFFKKLKKAPYVTTVIDSVNSQFIGATTDRGGLTTIPTAKLT